MPYSKQTPSVIAEVRVLASRFDVGTIEKCMELALRGEKNPCYASGEVENMMNVLAKASFVRGQMRLGMPLVLAIRELGKRVRALQWSESQGMVDL